MKAPALVELCAGSAAVSLRYLSAKGRPPLAWQGGKRGYADQILGAMGLYPGQGRDAEIILCEPGPWGEAWDLWRTPAGRADTIERLRAWADEDPRTLWERLRAAPVPADPAERVATWAVLQLWSFARKPVHVAGPWRTHGFNAAEAYNEQYRTDAAARGMKGCMGRKYKVDMTSLCADIGRLPDLSRLTVFRCDAAEVPPLPGAVVYLDPPYQGTTCAYGHDLRRLEVLAIGARWQAADASLVAISEAAPLPLPGWHAHELGGPSGFGRAWSRQRREFLTMSRPPCVQLGLLSAATSRAD